MYKKKKIWNFREKKRFKSYVRRLVSKSWVSLYFRKLFQGLEILGCSLITVARVNDVFVCIFCLFIIHYIFILKQFFLCDRCNPRSFFFQCSKCFDLLMNNKHYISYVCYIEACMAWLWTSYSLIYMI